MTAELRATYRLQLTTGFGFEAARRRIPYLRDLGVSHLYLSPSLQAREGSTHGYDVTDPTRLSSALGGEEQFEQLAEAARFSGMGLILDVVPNHMAASPENRYWADETLRRKFFDIDPVTGRHRRFFDIDDMAGVRQEDPEVFEQTHELVLALARGGLVDGLRVDHPDGLADPAEYLARLRAGGAERVWVEKILAPDERLRDWPVCGTVGYEFLNDACALFVDPRGEGPLTRLWQRVSGDGRGFEDVALEAKLEQASGTFRPEVERLARELDDGESPGAERGNSPKTIDDLAQGLSSLAIYRTYIDPHTSRIEDADREAIANLQPGIQRLLLDGPPGFITRFQQTTPAITAKGVEDTAFYRYGRLLALNDVGGDPARFGIGVEHFHARCAERVERFPNGLLTTMTHDAKRSGDIRARIGALASMAQDWAAVAERLFELSERHRRDGAPDDVERYFLFQTLVGTWPIELDRIQAYIEKALREAKRNTNWVDQRRDYERAVIEFCAAVYTDASFLAVLEPFIARIARAGERAALGQLALKLTAPGIPDIYQGDELAYRALVDPDNRRPVDWDYREALLKRLMGGSPVVEETRKLFLTMRLLGLRARRPEPFSGSYEALDAGPGTCAYLRGGEVMAVVNVRDGAGGGGNVIADPPGGRWRDVLSGEERSFDSRQPLERLLGENGFGVFERL